MARPDAPVASGNRASPHSALRLAARRHPLPDARICGGKGLSLTLPLPLHHSITSSAAGGKETGTVGPGIPAVTAVMNSPDLLRLTARRSAGLASLRMRPV